MSQSCHKNRSRCVQFTGAFLLSALALNSAASDLDRLDRIEEDLDHIDNQLEYILEKAERLRSRTYSSVEYRIETRVKTQVSARIRASLENAIDAKLDEKLIDQVSENISTAATGTPAMPGSFAPPPKMETAPQEVRETSSPRARVRSDSVSRGTDRTLDRLLDSRLERIESRVELALDTMLDAEGNTAISNEWLVLSDHESLMQLASEGYVIVSMEELDGLGYVLGTIAAPASFNPGGATSAAVQVLDSPQLAIDMNHVYMPQRDRPVPTGTTASSARPAGKQLAQTIGMIDSGIDVAHEALRGADIVETEFTPRGHHRTNQHGTAVASILVGESGRLQGVATGSNLLNGVVFATDDNGNEFSTTAAIVRAINWLAQQDVKLINMSLAGPDNAILAKAVDSACARGITLVSSVGNAGPAAAPLYPAAYDCTIAVTGIDSRGNPYHRANRGNHVDFALPGVNVLHAVAGGGYGQSSGTSYAAALLSGMIAANLPVDLGAVEIKRQLSSQVNDLGIEGADPVFGKGSLAVNATGTD